MYVSQLLDFSPILNYAFDLIFGYLKNILNLLWKVVRPKPNQPDCFCDLVYAGQVNSNYLPAILNLNYEHMRLTNSTKNQQYIMRLMKCMHSITMYT